VGSRYLLHAIARHDPVAFAKILGTKAVKKYLSTDRD
jgi:hypothetical protein